MMAATLKRGGILLGAFDEDRLVGFVYSFPGLKAGRPMQWSHMLGVADGYRGTGVGRLLKLEQRRATLAMGLDLIEWTYDPLQAVNAHLNFRRLGVTVDEYLQDVYSNSPSPLHMGTPTDRFVAQWELRSERVKRAIEHRGDGDPSARVSSPAPSVNAVARSDEWIAPSGVDLSRSDPELRVTIPVGFTEMLKLDPAAANTWRLHTRELFSQYLGRGYAVVDFDLDTANERGHYLLARTTSSSRPGSDARNSVGDVP